MRRPQVRASILEGIAQALVAIIVATIVLLGVAFIRRDEPRLQEDIGRQKGRAERAEEKIRTLEAELDALRAQLAKIGQRFEDPSPPSGGNTQDSSPAKDRDSGDKPHPGGKDDQVVPPPEPEPEPSPEPPLVCLPEPVGCVSPR